MTAPRLAASVLVGALVRRAEAEGGFAAILAKGDPKAGTLLVILLEKGGNPRIFERILQLDGSYSFTESTGKGVGDADELKKVLDRRRGSDPDMWVLELDVPSAERFAAEMRAAG